MDLQLFIGQDIFIVRARGHAFERTLKRIVFSALLMMLPVFLIADPISSTDKDVKLQSKIDAHRRLFRQHLLAKDVAKIEPLLQDTDPLVRSQAVATLGAIGGAQVVGDLKNVLLNDQDVGVRISAAFWLGSLQDPSASGTLKQAQQNDSDANVRGQATDALRKISTRK
jgi:hypothetical protein